MERHVVDEPGVDAAGDALTARATVDEHGTMTGWSAGAERLLGYTPTQILGRPAASLLAEEPPASALPSFSGLPRWHGTLVLRHRDGRRLEVKVLAHHRTTYCETRDWFLVSALTGTRPRPGDDALALRGFLDSPSCATSVHDTHLRWRRSNRASRDALGLGDDDLRGLRMTEAIDDPVMGEVERLMRQVLETGEPQYMENHARAPGETREHAWSVHLYRLENDDGRVLGVATTGHDMTEQYWARKRLQLIAEAGQRIGSTLDVTRTAQELADIAVPDLADFISVDLLASLDDLREPPPQAVEAGRALGLRRIAHQSVLPGSPEAVVAPGGVDAYPDGSPPVESLRSGRAVLYRVTEPAIADWVAQDQLRTSRIRDFGFHSVMTVPLSARGTTLGVAVFARHRHPEPFQQDDLVLAEELSARAAVSIDNALRYTRERATAVTLQRSLLPRSLPEQAAVEVVTRYLPAGARAGVGGDWFDVIPLSGARVALVVGDVVGHGIHASATMGRLRTAVRTLADIDLPPDELLTHLDDLVARLATEAEAGAELAAETGAAAGDVTEGVVGATCLYAVYDPVSRRCTLARAGHPLPVVVSPDGTAELLDLPAGPPLGLGGLPFESLETELPEGGLLALYTDGLIQSRDGENNGGGTGIVDGVTRLRRILATPAASLDALCDRVLGAVLPERPTDDVALLVARPRALDPDRVATWDVASDPSSVAEARKNALSRLESWGLNDAAFVTELVVSELVTNAIRHAEPPVQLRLIHDRSLICEVSDGSSTTPHMRRARTYDEGGRGLLLVAQLTERWGTRPTPTGKTIWTEQTLG
ncbi:SpoIIE family protein phosphatase [Streptomyces europaeiscabiei]|uniref:SpoIIE family protein phosphatase n=1 Tax=Streptomyces europaeiscabiei TaxID=146819 RepID=A0ABU4NKW6_9ACTN|nr:SpoIIE family protein phosphatase [Streptomyces europaeiscabiei]MDX2528354.1 SpoIIE family protein phosphatase [Streptomyces europaeiscabiei]MDX2771498.1 SpoIIE family protein phosphatase [Streptomyces europaeiscabiei]MDX3546147.1 SpoIIE family protein phosphatase [Streptomyces europaeiscabiei]MDX3557547.1 SpoIIE family protein phosphatase [Streptomyces europaeiscabiei]MDX3668036.1 SpoIIE family protein phosphatase [Streptomyces europaeiscabiei]